MRAGTRAWTGTGCVAAVAIAAFLVTSGSSPVCVEAQPPSVPLNTYIWLRSATDSDTYIRHSSFVLYAAPLNGDDSVFKVVPGLLAVAVGIAVSFQSANFPDL